MCNERLNEIMAELKRPFHPSDISWKPGAVKGDRALALAYADLRVYLNRLDEVCGPDWSLTYEPWGEDRIIANLTICGVTRSSTGESNKESERGEIGGTVAEAQAAKRACAMWGLGRYIYSLPTGFADFDPATKKFTEKAKAKLTGILVQHYRRATEGDVDAAQPPATGNRATDAHGTPQGASVPPSDSVDSNGDILFTPQDDDLDKLHKHFHSLGRELYNGKWDDVRHRNAKRVSNGRTESSAELTADEVQMLIDGMNQLKQKRQAA